MQIEDNRPASQKNEKYAQPTNYVDELFWTRRIPYAPAFQIKIDMAYTVLHVASNHTIYLLYRNRLFRHII